MPATLYENARVHTLDPARPHASALLVRGERIAAVGELAECRDLAGPGCVRVDLAGMAVLPGLTDSHIHSAHYARGLREVDLRGAAGMAECLDRVAAKARSLPAGAWMFGGRWNYHTWDRPVPPTRADLDRACPDRPVALSSVDGHSFWLNSRALRDLGIDARTPDPPGGLVVRDERGEPTGVLRETAGNPVREAMTAAGARDLPEALRQALPTLLAAGITSIHDIDGQDCRAAYESLSAAGELPLRVHKAIPVSALETAVEAGWSTGDGDRWLRTGPVKIFMDGALGSHTCLMSEPFDGEPDNYGLAVTPAEEVDRLVATASAAGIAVAAHAIGDEANRRILQSYERAAATASASPRRLRHRIEHAQHLRPADVAEFARLGVVASMQPIHCTSDAPLVGRMLAGRDLASYAWNSLRANGATVIFGSDAPVENLNPFHGLHAAVTRQRPDGSPPGGWQPGERLTLADALHAYTVAPAYASYEEHLKGRLRQGMLADFIALPVDPFTVDSDALHGLTVALTVVGGAVRWPA